MSSNGYDAMVLGNLGLAATIALQMGFRPWMQDWQDVMQEGAVGLCVARDRYDPSVAKFSTYAAVWIRNRLWDWRRLRQPVYVPQKAFAKRAYEEIGAEPLELEIDGDLVERDHEWLRVAAAQERDYLLSLVRDAFARLSPLLHWLLTERLGGRTLKEVGRQLGVSKEWARTLQKKALDGIRVALVHGARARSFRELQQKWHLRMDLL